MDLADKSYRQKRVMFSLPLGDPDKFLVAVNHISWRDKSSRGPQK